jgi:hypothetical protein
MDPIKVVILDKMLANLAKGATENQVIIRQVLREEHEPYTGF